MEFELSQDNFLMILTILNRSHPLPPDLNELFQTFNIIKNERIATFLINYLCMIINKNKCVALMPWPLIDKKIKSHFYVGLRKFLSESSKELSDFDFPKVLSSTLSLPNSDKYTTFLHKLLRCTFEIHVRKNLGFYDVPLSSKKCGEKFTAIITREANKKLKNKSLEESKLERLKELREKNKMLDEKLALAAKTETCSESIIEENLKSVIKSLDEREERKKASSLELDGYNASIELLMDLAVPEDAQDVQSLGVHDLESKLNRLCKISVADTSQNCLTNTLTVFTSKLANLLNLLKEKNQWLMENSNQMDQYIIEKSPEEHDMSLLFEDFEITMENGIETSINLTPQKKDISNFVQESKKKLLEELFTPQPSIIEEVKQNLSQCMLFKNTNRTAGTSASPLARSVLEKQTWNSHAVTPSRHSVIEPLKASSPLLDSFNTTPSEESIDCIFSDDSQINEQNTSQFLPIRYDSIDSIDLNVQTTPTSDFLPIRYDSIDSIDLNVQTTPRNSLEAVINRYRELKKTINEY